MKCSAQMASLRALSALGLPAELFIPAALEMMHGIIPSLRNLFDWTDAQGRPDPLLLRGPDRSAHRRPLFRGVPQPARRRRDADLPPGGHGALGDPAVRRNSRTTPSSGRRCTTRSGGRRPAHPAGGRGAQRRRSTAGLAGSVPRAGRAQLQPRGRGAAGAGVALRGPRARGAQRRAGGRRVRRAARPPRRAQPSMPMGACATSRPMR